MSGIGQVLQVAVSPLATALGAFKKKKPAAAPLPVPTATPRANSVVADALAARRGSAVNQRTGAGGAESSSGKKTLLGT